MNVAKGVLFTLLVLSTRVFAQEETYAVPPEANVDNKIVISINTETGAVEYQKADGSFQAVSNGENSLVQKAQYYPQQLPNFGPPQGGCCGPQYIPPPCCPQPQPYYYNQGNLYGSSCGGCGYRPIAPRVHVRKFRERQLYEYDVIPQNNIYGGGVGWGGGGGGVGFDGGGGGPPPVDQGYDGGF